MIDYCDELQNLKGINLLLPKNFSYSTVSTGSFVNTNINNTKHIPNLLIKAKRPNNSNKVYRTVVENIQDNIIVPIQTVIEKKDGSVIVKCKNGEDVASRELNLKKSMGEYFEVEAEKLTDSTMKIIGIFNNMSLEELTNDINERNFSELEQKCTVDYIFPAGKDSTRNAIIIVPPECYLKIRSENNKIFNGHQSCRCYDDINVTLCTKCGRTGHNYKKRQNQLCCLKCAEIT